jgi:hypothetical protein
MFPATLARAMIADVITSRAFGQPAFNRLTTANRANPAA